MGNSSIIQRCCQIDSFPDFRKFSISLKQYTYPQNQMFRLTNSARAQSTREVQCVKTPKYPDQTLRRWVKAQLRATIVQTLHSCIRFVFFRSFKPYRTQIAHQIPGCASCAHYTALPWFNERALCAIASAVCTTGEMIPEMGFVEKKFSQRRLSLL